MNKTIGLRIKILRQRHGLTQADLADKLGITQTHLSALERGRKGWTLDLIFKVSKIFHVSPSLLQDPSVPIDKINEIEDLIKSLSKLPPERLKAISIIAYFLKDNGTKEFEL